MTEQKEKAARELTEAVEHFVREAGWSEPDLTLTDVMVVAVRRGFDVGGGKSVTSTIVPTDSSVPMLLGMAKYASMRFEKIVAESFTDEGY